MRSITTWYRIEPRSDGAHPGPDAGLEARLYDPAWLLGRQWQLGELGGEDAASPAWVQVHVATTPIDQLGDTNADAMRSVTPGEELEPQVEAEAPLARWYDAVTAGQHWVAALLALGLESVAQAFREEFPVLDPDPSGAEPVARARFRVLRRTSLDGAALLAATRDGSGQVRLPARPVVPPERRDEVRRALRAWARWYPPPQEGAGSWWVTERLEYHLRISAGHPTAPGRLVLEAPAYQGGRLDWHDFRAANDLPDAGPAPRRTPHSGLPTRVGYPGMPANRWWELEDGFVSFPSVESDSGDLARMLLVEFAAVYGNDWFLAPVDVPFGSVVAVEGVVVANTFDEAILVGPSTAADWRMYEVSGWPTGRIVVPPVVSGAAEGLPIEEVQLTRDEMANLAWAIERTVEGVAGDRVDRHQAWRDRISRLRPEPVPDLPDAALVYTLTDEPPDHWTPLVPVRVAERSNRLRRGIFRHQDAGFFPPLGRLLDASRPFSLFEEEVPRSGINMTRSWQRARSSNGGLLVWLGRRARQGRGESRSQVAFDRLRPDPGDQQ